MNSKTRKSIHVVLGLDKEAKPRAALIQPADLEAVTKAAASMGFKIGRADSPQALQVARQLPDAQVFATGKGLVPLVRKDIYEWLSKGLAFLDAKAEPVAGKDGPAPVAAATSTPKDGNDGSGAMDASSQIKLDPRLWDQLTVGSLVVAPEGNVKADGYWPAVITNVSKDGQKLTLRWRDYPKQPPLTVKRRAVALLLDHG